ncbi:glycoside hydrolase family 97 protein [Opitutales bacterium ASA1]|uniref:glycoside hydrolase family 97 protein n=1 Tax=Congregicoccus parvus TaxID=3081749 RepID=UPI002B29692C|nr:glycoside hydrolase family 97 protein [Opitutales bacterium ASA1]
MTLRSLFPGLAALVFGSCSFAQSVTLESPDAHLTLTFEIAADGAVTHALSVDGIPTIVPSPVGFVGGRFLGAERRSEDTVWKPVWGKRATVPDRYHEATLDLGAYHIQARAYDDGVAFRYVFPGEMPAGAEATHFVFAGDYTAWFTNGENHNIGPEKLGTVDGRRLPVATLETDHGTYLALHEADLGDGDPLLLESTGGETSLRVASAPSTAWRVVMFGRTPSALVDSHLLELLNPPPPADMDFAWVKPGVAVWDWRINGARVDGFSYDMSLESWKRMVDFASENRMPHLVLDANWYGPEFGQDSDPVKGGKVNQVRAIIAYGKTKDVGIWLYLNDVGGRQFPLEDTLRQYGEWGATGVKYGFMHGSPQEMNRRTRLITELCAKHRLLCNFHDHPVHPYGQMRTWPNAVTREFCQAQLDGHKVFQPKTFVTSVFVNMLAGPVDMNNGLADLTQAGRVDHGVPVPSTLAAEAARTLIVFSGATIIPDIPEHYRKHPELLRFLAAQQMPWRESRTLAGEIGEYIVMARQAADGAWLVGAATNESPRELEVPLSFLPAGAFEALVVQDGPESDYRTHAEDYRAETRPVSRTDTIRLTLAPGGGACILIDARR